MNVTDLVNIASRVGESCPPPPSDYVAECDVTADCVINVAYLVNTSMNIGLELQLI